MPSYTCDAVNNAFLAMSGYISPTIMSKVSPNMRPYFTSTPRGKWIDGMGQVHQSITWERTVPTDNGDEWVDVTVSDGADVDACNLTPEVVHFGQTLRSVRRQNRNIQTDEFCLTDLRDDFQIGKTLGGVMRNLTWITTYVWETRDQREYIRLSDHKVTEGDPFNLEATAFDPAFPPTSRLTLGTLEQIYNYLLMDGAGVEGAVGSMGSGRPVFDLMTDPNTSRDLIRQDPQIREDFRFAYMGEGVNSPLLGMLGTGVAYDGYRHVFAQWPQRFDLVGSTFMQRFPYKDPAAASKGYKQDIDLAYQYAAYQITTVHIPTVFTQLVPDPITSPGGGVHFDPVNRLGVFNWLNIKDKKCNPRGEKGFFDAVFESASDPGMTNYGFAILHLNCPPRRDLHPSCYS